MAGGNGKAKTPQQVARASGKTYNPINKAVKKARRPSTKKTVKPSTKKTKRC